MSSTTRYTQQIYQCRQPVGTCSRYINVVHHQVHTVGIPMSSTTSYILGGAFTQSVLRGVIRRRLGYLINKKWVFFHLKNDHFTRRILPQCECYCRNTYVVYHWVHKQVYLCRPPLGTCCRYTQVHGVGTYTWCCMRGQTLHCHIVVTAFPLSAK